MNRYYCLFTNDVETTSILNHRLSDATADIVLTQGMPRLLDLYDKYDIKATFFYTGYIAKLKPDIVMMAHQRGHEVGSHGLSHRVEVAFDVLSFETQKQHLSESKKIIENIIGQEIISFRAPAARVSKNIAAALMETGYKVDSSIASQRLDMFLSFGSLKKLNWLTTPRKPYFTTHSNIFKKGNSPILEIPISAFGFPYIGTFMRVAPTLNRLNRNLLYFETKITGRHFNFLTHPNEFIDEEKDLGSIQKRGSNLISSFLGDVVRHKLKVKNLGKVAIPLLERELQFFKKHNFQFVTCKDVYLQKKPEGFTI